MGESEGESLALQMEEWAISEGMWLASRTGKECSGTNRKIRQEVAVG